MKIISAIFFSILFVFGYLRFLLILAYGVLI